MNIVIKDKHLNRLPIYFEKELYMNLFNEINLRYNISNKEYVELNFATIKTILGAKQKSILFEKITDMQNVFKIDDENIFRYDISYERGIVKITPAFKFKKYFLTKNDIGMFLINKESNGNNILIEDVEYTESIKGKYMKRFFMLVNQFRKTGVLIIKMDDLRSILNFPNSYRVADIDKQLFDRLINENTLSEQNITVKEIIKHKNGRNIDWIEIRFDGKYNYEFNKNKAYLKKLKDDFLENGDPKLLLSLKETNKDNDNFNNILMEIYGLSLNTTYILKTDGFYKIGFTKNLKERLKYFKNKIDISNVYIVNRDIEKFIHKKLAFARFTSDINFGGNTECFNINENTIIDIIAEYGFSEFKEWSREL